MMKLRENLPEHEIEAHCREWETLFEQIPGILTVSMGTNLRLVPADFTHALVIRFENLKALDSFMTHPKHAAAGQQMLALFSDFLIFDYETERA
jgi:antibiotic biosynthesis monooxygenase (ABM) superfamily enzyme